MENPHFNGNIWGENPTIFGNIHLGNCSHKQLHKEPAPNPPWCRSAAASTTIRPLHRIDAHLEKKTDEKKWTQKIQSLFLTPGKFLFLIQQKKKDQTPKLSP